MMGAMSVTVPRDHGAKLHGHIFVPRHCVVTG